MEPNEAPGPATVHDPRPGAPRWGLVQRARYATGCTTDAVGMAYVVLRSIDGATQHWDLSISARRERDAGKRGDVGGRRAEHVRGRWVQCSRRAGRERGGGGTTCVMKVVD